MKISLPLIQDVFLKLDPRIQFKNPVLFITELGALLCTFCLLWNPQPSSFSFELQITLWLWSTLLFANLAESLAEGRGKAQAASLKKMRTSIQARLFQEGKETWVSSGELKKGDVVLCQQGDLIPGDGEVIEGIASVNESAITGESAPVIRESGGDRSAVTGGTLVVSDRILIKMTTEPGHSFLDRMIHLVEGASRQKTPNELALNVLLAALTLIFLLAVMTLGSFLNYSATHSHQDLSQISTVPIFVALLVCLIPTTIGGLLSAIGISGMDRLIRKNVIAISGRAVEAAGDVDTLLLDKTGTITLGNRMATDFFTLPGIEEKQLAEAAFLASLSDETPEGRSILVLAQEKYHFSQKPLPPGSVWVPFSAQTRMSGLDLPEEGRSLRKGAEDSIQQEALSRGGRILPQLHSLVNDIAKKGGTPLVVLENAQILGVIALKDVVKAGMKERFAELRKMGIRTIMITGDNPITAAAIAAEAGVDDFMAKATPEDKLKRIYDEQNQGHLVAMTGDGTNDAPALAQADVGVAMNTGTQAAREAGNMVDLDSNPTKLIEIVEVGKQLLMTRGALTTLSITNDIAKYFAILPALFGTLYALPGEQEGPLICFNLMKLHSPQSALLSSLIFNALMIVALIPLALQGVAYEAKTASEVLRKNLLLYGGGGVILPFIGIKIIDLLIVSLGLIS